MQHWLQIHANILHAVTRNLPTHLHLHCSIYVICYFGHVTDSTADRPPIVLYKWPTVWLNPHVGQHTWDVSPPPPDLLTNRSRVCVTLQLHSILGCLLIHPHILIRRSINYPEIQSVVTWTCSASARYNQTFPLLGLPVDLLLLWPAFSSSSGALKAAFWWPVRS